jgi:serine/threonine-protein kinase
MCASPDRSYVAEGTAAAKNEARASISSPSSDERGELRGQVIDGRYRIVRRIGLGGTGVVFEAQPMRGGDHVALKTLRPCFISHPDLGRRLQREGEVARRVRHPGIVPVTDEGTLLDGSPYLVMPLLRGESMSRILLRAGSLSIETVAVLATRTAAILHSAHCAGYVHRDVKPEHVLLDIAPGGELLVSLLDFGVCSSKDAPSDERLREKGKVFGTPSYVSPEQAAGEHDIDARADLFSLGVVMFEALAGKLPFTASSVSKLLVRIIREEAPRLREVLPHVDPAISDIVARLLARDPHDRFPSARALARALAPHVGERVQAEARVAAMLRLAPHVTRPISDTEPTQVSVQQVA